MYARVDEVRVGTVLRSDGGFTCMDEGEVHDVMADADGDLYIACRDGGHWLLGQLDEGTEYIGLTIA